jgi:hypothetical protein
VAVPVQLLAAMAALVVDLAKSEMQLLILAAKAFLVRVMLEVVALVVIRQAHILVEEAEAAQEHLVSMALYFVAETVVLVLHPQLQVLLLFTLVVAEALDILMVAQYYQVMVVLAVVEQAAMLLLVLQELLIQVVVEAVELRADLVGQAAQALL